MLRYLKNLIGRYQTISINNGFFLKNLYQLLFVCFIAYINNNWCTKQMELKKSISILNCIFEKYI